MTRALGFFADRGITVERVLTDNGSCYRSRIFAATLAEAGVSHRRTRPYRPQTNGKIERFNLTLEWEWAYARPYGTNASRAEALERWAPSLQLPSTPHGSCGKGADHGREQRAEEAHLGDRADEGLPEEQPAASTLEPAPIEMGLSARQQWRRPLRILEQVRDQRQGRGGQSGSGDPGQRAACDQHLGAGRVGGQGPKPR